MTESVTLDYETTRACIARHAAARPSDTAIIDGGNIVTFADFHRDLGKFIHVARSFELGAGSTVAVEWTSLYWHWLLLLAFEDAGVATYSYAKEEAASQTLLDADLVIGTAQTIPKGCKRSETLTESWIARCLAGKTAEFEDTASLTADKAVRVHYGSGTTGRQKCMVKTGKNHAFRIWQYQRKLHFDRNSRYLVTQSFCLQGIYLHATTCLRAGGTCVLNQTQPLHGSLSQYDITHASFLPGILAQTLEAVPDEFAKPKRLRITTFGGRVSQDLRARAQQVLGAEILESYSTNETGSICTIGPDGRGEVLPGMRVEAVDESGAPVTGVPGRIRVKSDGCIDGYRDDKEATDRMFQDGWFYPGDIGVMHGSEWLELIGRQDDLINIAGVKLDPAALEEQLRQAFEVDDLCITSVPGALGNEQVCVALVLNNSTRLRDIQEAMAAKMPPIVGPVRLLKVSKIPRTKTGKARRNRLRTVIAAQAADLSGGG